MWEVVYIAASLRLPICMALVNRALSGNINIHNDHSDTMGGRDAGWIQLFCENAQEAYDTALMCWRIAEHKEIDEAGALDRAQCPGGEAAPVAGLGPDRRCARRRRRTGWRKEIHCPAWVSWLTRSCRSPACPMGST